MRTLVLLAMVGMIGCQKEAVPVPNIQTNSSGVLQSPTDDNKLRMAVRSAYLQLYQSQSDQVEEMCGEIQREHLATRENRFAQRCHDLRAQIAEERKTLDALLPEAK